MQLFERHYYTKLIPPTGYTYNVITNKMMEYYAGSKIINKIPAFSNMIDQVVSNYKSFNYYLKTDNYGPIIYDKYRNLYYRIAEKAGYHTNETYKYLKQLSVIILDAQLNIIGEKTFDGPYGTTLLVSPNGIYIPYIKNVGMDLPMHYHVFNVCKNE